MDISLLIVHIRAWLASGDGEVCIVTHEFVKSCLECAVVSGSGNHQPPPLHPIPVKRPFQFIEVDTMDLLLTTKGNKHVIVFQDYLTKINGQ